MNRILTFGTVLYLFLSPALGSYPLRLSEATIEASQVIFEPNIPTPKVLNREIGFSTEQRFPLPREAPCYLVLQTRSNLEGRLNLFLDPIQLPADLQEALSKQEEPVQQPSFQVVIDTRPDEWQLHTLDLAADFFETVRPTTLPYDPAGTAIRQIRLEVAEPSRSGLEISIKGLKVVKLTDKAMRADLEDRAGELRQLQNIPGQDSGLRRYWQLRISTLTEQVEEFSASGDRGIHWRRLARQLDEVFLQKEKWSMPDQPYAVVTDSSLKRISTSHPKFTFRGESGDSVHLEAGRNEYESFQLVIVPLKSDLRRVRFEASDLVASDGKSTIPSDHLEFYHQIEQYVQPSRGTAYDWAGWLPDALLPVEGPFGVKASETKPIWATLYVPENTAEGEYTGEIKTIVPGESDVRVRLSVQIHDFAIPKVGRFRTQGHFSLEDLQSWYREEYTPLIRKDFYRLLVRYRQSPTSQYSARLSPESEDIPWIVREGGNVILIGGFSGQDLDPEIIEPAYRWLVENEYIDQAIIYVGDETDDFEKMKAKARTIRRNWPKLRIMIGGSKPREELIGYFDVWDPITYGGAVYNFDPESTRAALERGEEMFWYTCVGPRAPYANVYNDHPLTAIRALWWQAWKYQISGFEYWWFNYWRPNLNLNDGSSPWPASRLREWNSRSFKWSNGDGVLVYPGPQGTALPSIRLSVMRDAIEDWEIIFMLDRTVELAKKTRIPGAERWISAAERLLEVPDEITTDLTEWSRDPQVYLKAREEVYRLLTTLRKTIGSQQTDQYIEKWVQDRQSWLQRKFEERVAASR